MGRYYDCVVEWISMSRYYAFLPRTSTSSYYDSVGEGASNSRYLVRIVGCISMGRCFFMPVLGSGDVDMIVL